MAAAYAKWEDKKGERIGLILGGEWNASASTKLEPLIRNICQETETKTEEDKLKIDCSAISGFDMIGAYLLHKLRIHLNYCYKEVVISGLSVEQDSLLREVVATPNSPIISVDQVSSGMFPVLEDIGEAVILAGRDLCNGIAFLGAVVTIFGHLLIGKKKFRFPSIVNQLEKVGLRGVPIVCLISFLVGAIISQQTIFQLRIFGTVHFVADLLGILILRELCVLLSSIMIAGRSGSAFTAEIGSMKMREEIDALQTMGLDPLEVLVAPRIIALIIALPLLTFVSSVSGILGGALVAFTYGGVSWDVFFSRLQNAIAFNTFMVGMIKAPFMALVIGLIACMEGLSVRGSAESLGTHTTSSVVKSIFIVIVVDGAFAMFFASINY